MAEGDLKTFTGLDIQGAMRPGYSEILSAPALALVEELDRLFRPARMRILANRIERQARFDAGELPDFRSDTRDIRDGDWQVAAIPERLQDRRVEITGPVERKMIINAMNSGAKVFMADFEDSSAPTWDAMVQGQVNLRDAVAGTITFTSPEGKHYALNERAATLIVRPRGWHLPEKHVLRDGKPLSASLFDFALFAFHNARTLSARNAGPYFYLPKLECREEAQLWDEVLAATEVRLGLPVNSFKVTVLIETLPAVFEMDEILHALRGRIAGLNCGRWDYIFSYIKTFRRHANRVLPERGQITMAVPFLKAYSELLIQTCHRRGAHAMGGMAAQIPISGDAEANARALERVSADKLREARAGHDGTWVAHPGLIPLAMQIFDVEMPKPNQRHVLREDVTVSREDLIRPCEGTITRGGFLNNIEVGLRYTAAWLDGQGCVPIHHLMEDAATAEIARSQLWQWTHLGHSVLEDGTRITLAFFDEALDWTLADLRGQDLPGKPHLDAAAALFRDLTHAPDLADFLTLPAYEKLE